jgi:hypothetical protein
VGNSSAAPRPACKAGIQARPLTGHGKFRTRAKFPSLEVTGRPLILG